MNRTRPSGIRNALSLVCFAAACSGSSNEAAPVVAAAALPHWSWDSSLVFPADQSLSRAEDGVALPDGRLLVVDQVHGLRLVETDGTSKPFGDLKGAGYVHNPPAHSGGVNGLSLEPDGAHVLVADVFGAAIYRVNVSSGATEKVYQHQYGINTAVRDSRGAIWFTQSAHNTPEAGEARMWANVDRPAPEGALLRLASENGKLAAEATVVVDSLFFANGVAIDEPSGHLYLAETAGGKVWRFRVDLATGALSERSVFVDSVGADNIELDGEGNLWVASPLANEVLVVNTTTGARHSAFNASTPEQAKIVAEFNRRGLAGEPRMDLFTPALWVPLPGLITGVIVGPGRGPVYLTGLGNALVRLPR